MSEAEERIKAGKSVRKLLPRSGHAEWQPDPARPDPVSILAAEDQSRVEDLVPVRYGRMLASAFTFFRGAAGIMAADLGSLPDSGLTTQLCGDAHLSNFGAFMAPSRRLVFDINDFDETLPGPFEWDVKRLGASFEIGGRDRGFGARARRAAVLEAVRSYRKAMAGFATMSEIDVWYARLDVADIVGLINAKVSKRDRKRFAKNVKKARNKDSLRALAKLTETHGGRLRIANRPPVLTPIEALAEGDDEAAIGEAMRGLLGEYRETLDGASKVLLDRYEYIHAGRKVVGVGSVGTRSWIALLQGKVNADPMFLQIKEAGPSVLEPFAGASEFKQHGERVVTGQRLMQATGDILLGWITATGLDGHRRDFYVRQLWDGKGSAEIELMSEQAMVGYAGLCGWSLARAHARSGDRHAISAYLGKSDTFDRAITDFSGLYADQNEADYRLLLAAEKAGSLTVERGV